MEPKTKSCNKSERNKYPYISGNGGGYLGLFLGCALSQVPDFLRFLSTTLGSIFQSDSKKGNVLKIIDLKE